MDLIEKAFQVAVQSHTGEFWKQTKRQMIYHPLGVASLVFRHGGNQTQAIAALLHDAYGRPNTDATTIELSFGTETLQMLEGFTDPPVPKEALQDWAYCKKAYLEKISGLEENTLFVILCEELHELGELVQDLRNEGTAVWKRYPVPDRDITWYFRKMTEIAYKRFTGKNDGLVQEMSRWTRTLTGFVHEGESL